MNNNNDFKKIKRSALQYYEKAKSIKYHNTKNATSILKMQYSIPGKPCYLVSYSVEILFCDITGGRSSRLARDEAKRPTAAPGVA